MIMNILSTLLNAIGGANSLLIWAGLGVLLLILDMLFPGVFLLFLGLASLLTMAVLWLIPLSLWGAIVCFSLSTFILLMCFGRIYKKWINHGPPNSINQNSKRYIGHEIILNDPIIHGKGRIVYAGSMWTLHGPDAPKGSTVRIVKRDGNVLEVEIIKKY